VLSGTNQIFIGANNKTTNISGSIVNIADTGLSATGRVKIASGTNVTGSEVTIGTTTLTNLFLRGNEVKINEAGGGTVFIGNPTTGSTDINSNGISIGKQLSGAGYISIGSEAVTTTGYCVFGSAGMDASYIRARNIYMNTESGNITMGNAAGTSSFYGNIKMGLDSPTFKNIISYRIEQPSSYANVYRYISFVHTFASAPVVLVSAAFDYSGYVGYAQVRSITTTGFYYSLVLHSTSIFAIFYAGDPHILSYTAIGT
jgi:hypothetical protein